MLIKERLKEIVLPKIYMREVRRDIRKARAPEKSEYNVWQILY